MPLRNRFGGRYSPAEMTRTPSRNPKKIWGRGGAFSEIRPTEIYLGF